MKTALPLVADINRTRKIGCEFECTVPLVGSGTGGDVQQTLATVFTANGLRAISRGYSSTPLPPNTDLAVEYDSSVHGETRYAGIEWCSVEVKTRVLNGIGDWERIVPKTLDIMKYMGARVNSTTGHHVHLSFNEVLESPKAARSLYALMCRIEPVVFGLLAPSRRNSTYCRPMAARPRLLDDCTTFDDIRNIAHEWDRYHGFNLRHLMSEPPRIEFRYHQGTLDATKSRHWLRFLLRLMDHGCARTCQASQSQIPNTRQGLERMLISCGLKVNSRIYGKVCPELRETGRFLLRRWKGFNLSDSSAQGQPTHESTSDGDSERAA